MDSKSTELDVAVCQLTSNDEPEANIASVSRILEGFRADRTPDLVCFPENSFYLHLADGGARPSFDINDPLFQPIRAWARESASTVHIGSVPLLEGHRVFNASLLFTPDGAVSCPYKKIHLFDVDVEGARPVRESELFAHGESPAVFAVKGWKFGSSICYDIRFAELFLQYANAEVDAILIPSAFLVPTGQAHWEILVRARAIENQAYVLAAAQGGRHIGRASGERETYGHSMIVDPWGRVLAEGDGVSTCVLRATLQRDRITGVRKQIPMRAHRRLSARGE